MISERSCDTEMNGGMTAENSALLSNRSKLNFEISYFKLKKIHASLVSMRVI